MTTVLETLLPISPDAELSPGKWMLYGVTSNYQERLFSIETAVPLKIKDLGICSTCTISGAEKISK